MDVYGIEMSVTAKKVGATKLLMGVFHRELVDLNLLGILCIFLYDELRNVIPYVRERLCLHDGV
jgi:hypothetical protein